MLPLPHEKRNFSFLVSVSVCVQDIARCNALPSTTTTMTTTTTKRTRKCKPQPKTDPKRNADVAKCALFDILRKAPRKVRSRPFGQRNVSRSDDTIEKCWGSPASDRFSAKRHRSRGRISLFVRKQPPMASDSCCFEHSIHMSRDTSAENDEYGVPFPTLRCL
ncbi:uncharacterized protein ZHAS_00020804 [Anopheles sinensis]|uniref:Uncharacterized protein n=1 Tax=Anopheles sinensis TaxID=74873 RepID=A0A084WQR7_ANOSI|nr:uncharacterized protein ZHAS_00020804 [Anopheles sinensis]